MSSPPVERVGPFSWMKDRDVTRVMAALGGDAARFVGGAVRDTLLGRPVVDIDIATRLPPETVIERLGAANIATVPTGLDHGTVTALVPGRTVEITTLRRDLETDGRHARVALIDDWSSRLSAWLQDGGTTLGWVFAALVAVGLAWAVARRHTNP